MYLSFKSLFNVFQKSFPLIVFYMSEIAIGISDLIIVGSLGADELSSVGLGKNVVLTTAVIFFGVISITSNLISSEIGEGKEDRAFIILRASIFVSIVLSFLGVIVSKISIDVLMVLSYEEKTVDFYSDYLLYSKYLIFPALFLASYRCLLNSLEDTRIFYWAAAVAVSLNIILNIILVHGVSIIPEMGVKGAGLATFIVNVIGFLIVHLYLKVKYDLKFKYINPFLANILVVFNILRKGGPAGIQQILEGGLFTCVMILMGYFSSNWLAATSVIFSILEITFVISLGISEVASAKLSQWISSGRLLESKLLVNSTFSLVIIVMFLLSVVFYFYPSIVVSVFISSKENENAFSVTMWMLSIVAFFMIFDGLQVSGIYILRGMHETIKSLVISIFCYWIVGLGSGLLFAFIFDLGPKGIFFGFCLGLLTSGLSLVYMSYKFLRINYRV